jgi:hypothetical protein
MALSQQAYNHVQLPALCATLSKLHFNRNISRAIVFGPGSLGGINILVIYDLQSTGQLTLLISHLRIQDEVGQLIPLDLSILQLTGGALKPVLDLPFSSYM